MASKKDKSAKAGSKVVRRDESLAEGQQPSAISIAPASSASDTRWIVREAAWVRMFGRIDAKNPFAR